MLHLSDTERKTLCAAAGHHHPGVTCLLPAAVEAILTARLARVEALVADWQANGNSRELGDPTDVVWFKCAEQLLAALAAPTPTEVQQ